MTDWADVCARWLEAGRAYRKATEDTLRGLQCVYCDAPAQALDHVIARANGGPDDPLNLVPVCRVCNGQKSARTLEEWAAGLRADLARVTRKRRQLQAIERLLAVPAPSDFELDAALDRVA